jgi:hypothetical protein
MALRNTFIILLSALLFTQTCAASDKDELVGTWLLVHSQVLNESGNWEVPENSVGMIGSISYSANGYMSFQSSRSNRSEILDGRIDDMPIEGLRAFLSSYSAYYGTYEIDEENRTVTHNIIGSSFRSPAGTSTVRTYSFSGSQLTLLNGENRRFVWKRP